MNNSDKTLKVFSEDGKGPFYLNQELLKSMIERFEQQLEDLKNSKGKKIEEIFENSGSN